MTSRCTHDNGNVDEHACCHHQSSNPSVNQTLEELDFDRGIWSSAVSGDYDGVQKKLQRDKSVVNLCDQSGFRALHYASRNGHLDMCKLLIEFGADVNVTTSSTKATPLHRAAYMGHSDVVSLLLAHGAAVDVVDCDGKTPLDKAVERGHDNVVAVLRETSKCVKAKQYSAS